MSDSKRIVIIGGHGKVALLAAPKLSAAGYRVDSIIRNPDHAGSVRAAGGHPVELDIESADVDAMVDVFTGASAVVFSAGAIRSAPVPSTMKRQRAPCRRPNRPE